MPRKRRRSSIYLCIFECARRSTQRISGDNDEEEIPVPMPNTEVKLLSAEDTYKLPCWENRKSPVFLCLFYSKLVENNKISI